MSGGVIHPIPTSADNGYRFADRKLIESQINERTRAILVTNPGNPTGLVLTHEEMRVIADVVKSMTCSWWRTRCIGNLSTMTSLWVPSARWRTSRIM